MCVEKNNIKLYSYIYMLIFHRCIPEKDTETCYYLDPSAGKETNLKQNQEEELAEIPEVPKGRE